MNIAAVIRLVLLSGLQAPRVLAQGLAVRRTTLRLPDAAGTTGREGDPSGAPLQLVILGDSLAAAVGVDHHGNALGGHLARRIAARTGRAVDWTVLARTGATAGEVAALVDEHVLRPADVVVVSVGVNDAKDLHTLRRWRTELEALLDLLIASAPRARIVLLPVAPMADFPALPTPLADVLGRRAARLNAVATEVLIERPQLVVPALNVPGSATFAADGFHPSGELHAIFADEIAAVLGHLQGSGNR